MCVRGVRCTISFFFSSFFSGNETEGILCIVFWIRVAAKLCIMHWVAHFSIPIHLKLSALGSIQRCIHINAFENWFNRLKRLILSIRWDLIYLWKHETIHCRTHSDEWLCKCLCCFAFISTNSKTTTVIDHLLQHIRWYVEMPFVLIYITIFHDKVRHCFFPFRYTICKIESNWKVHKFLGFWHLIFVTNFHHEMHADNVLLKHL